MDPRYGHFSFRNPHRSAGWRRQYQWLLLSCPRCHLKSLMISSSPNSYCLCPGKRIMSLFLKGYVFQREFPQQSHWELTDIVLPFMPSPQELDGQTLVVKYVRPWRTPAWTCFRYNYKAHSYGCGRAVNGHHGKKMPALHMVHCPGTSLKCVRKWLHRVTNCEHRGCWFMEKLNHRRGISQTVQVSSAKAVQWAVSDKEILDHLRLWGIWSLVLGWIYSELFLPAATSEIGSMGLGKLSLRQASDKKLILVVGPSEGA